jgi:hypothetical protein
MIITTTNDRESALEHIRPPIQFSTIIPPHILQRDQLSLRLSGVHPRDRLSEQPALIRSTARQRINQKDINLYECLVLGVLEGVSRAVAKTLQVLIENSRSAAVVGASSAEGEEDAVVERAGGGDFEAQVALGEGDEDAVGLVGEVGFDG